MKSSFLSMERDLKIIISEMLKNENLKKLLYYPDKNCLLMDNLNENQSVSLINNQIKIIPKIEVNSKTPIQIIISNDNFTTNSDNPEFRDNIISFDIICHFDVWNLGDLQLRPYKIAGQLDGMFNNTRLTGVGKINFLGASQIILNEEYAGLSLMYQIIHGEEDKG